MCVVFTFCASGEQLSVPIMPPHKLLGCVLRKITVEESRFDQRDAAKHVQQIIMHPVHVCSQIM